MKQLKSPGSAYASPSNQAVRRSVRLAKQRAKKRARNGKLSPSDQAVRRSARLADERAKKRARKERSQRKTLIILVAMRHLLIVGHLFTVTSSERKTIPELQNGGGRPSTIAAIGSSSTIKWRKCCCLMGRQGGDFGRRQHQLHQ